MPELSQQELEARFQKRIDENLYIEPKDWMLDKYRQNLIRQIHNMPIQKWSGCYPKATG